jgi:hypothetical protein
MQGMGDVGRGRVTLRARLLGGLLVVGALVLGLLLLNAKGSGLGAHSGRGAALDMQRAAPTGQDASLRGFKNAFVDAYPLCCPSPAILRKHGLFGYRLALSVKWGLYREDYLFGVLAGKSLNEYVQRVGAPSAPLEALPELPVGDASLVAAE